MHLAYFHGHSILIALIQYNSNVPMTDTHAFIQSSLCCPLDKVTARDPNPDLFNAALGSIFKVNPLLFRSLLTVHLHISFRCPFPWGIYCSAVLGRRWVADSRHVKAIANAVLGLSLQWCLSLSCFAGLHRRLHLAKRFWECTSSTSFGRPLAFLYR